MFVDIRKRLGGEEFDAFNKLVIEKSKQIKPHQSRIKCKGKPENQDDDTKSPEGNANHGTLKVDATVAEKFPGFFVTFFNFLKYWRKNTVKIFSKNPLPESQSILINFV